MRIGIIGGGPAGLYFALLMKRRDARHEIRVVEQNPPGATYGWGLVFAAPTLRMLAESDAGFHADLRADCMELDTMAIGHRGARVPVRGNRWARISAHRDAGHAPAPLPPRGRGDRVRVAGGGRRPLRDRVTTSSWSPTAWPAPSAARHTDWFEPSFERFRNKFAWYGTTALIPALSLLFRENADGIFIAHCYQYSRTHSTFLVECAPEAWERGRARSA